MRMSLKNDTTVFQSWYWHWHSQIYNISIIPIITHPHFYRQNLFLLCWLLVPYPLANGNMFSISIILLYKWKHFPFLLSKLFSFTFSFWRVIHIIVCFSNLFLTQKEQYPWYGYITGTSYSQIIHSRTPSNYLNLWTIPGLA